MYNRISQEMLLYFICQVSEGLEMGQWICTSVRFQNRLSSSTNAISVHTFKTDEANPSACHRVRPDLLPKYQSKHLPLPELLLCYLLPALSVASLGLPCPICHSSLCFLLDLLCVTFGMHVTG